MRNEELNKLKEEYNNIKISEALDDVVRKSILMGKKNLLKKNLGGFSRLCACLVLVFVISINAVPSFAASVENIPMLKQIVQFINLRTYFLKDTERQYDISAEAPQITGLTDTELQAGLNEKFLHESQQLYEDFMKETNLTESKLVNHELDSQYSFVSSTGKLVVIAHRITETKASSMETAQYITIDTENNLVLTLPLIFKDNSYVETISENIKSQMKEIMGKDPSKIYNMDTGDSGDFNQISAEQSFYINEDGKLVIVFDEYDVAPGYMGKQEFVIPTEILESNIFTHKYLK